MEIKELRLMVDVISKYLVLFAFVIYIGFFVWNSTTKGTTVNLPDWIVMLFTLVFQYFFRRSPKEGDNGKVERKDTGLAIK